MTGSIQRPIFVVLIVLVLTAACGDDDGVDPIGAGATTAGPDSEPATTAVTVPLSEPTTAATTVPDSESITTTTTGAPTTAVVAPVSASERLAEFFAAAEDLDRRIKAAADQVNDTFDPETGTVSGEAARAIDALNAAPLAHLVPGGMTEDLEVAVLAVFADLDSRIAALVGGVGENGDLECLGFGALSAQRFPGDLAAARSLAATAPALVTAPDSPESGMVAVRLVYIQGSNSCCGSCGGYIYEESIEVDWEGRIFGPGWINAPFVATFAGESWQVEFPQAG